MDIVSKRPCAVCSCAPHEVQNALEVARQNVALIEERDALRAQSKDDVAQLAAMCNEVVKLRAALEKVMPIVEEAFWDSHTAGTLPGSGYNHRVYRKVSDIFGWRESKVFTDWKKSLGLK